MIFPALFCISPVPGLSDRSLLGSLYLAMIRRYSRPEMRQIWEEETKLSIWLQIELLALEALVQEGIVPEEDFRIIRERASFTVDRCHEIEKVVNHDVIAFTTDSLNEPVWVTGRIKARLYVSSDCPDTDFTVKICDVYPDGRSMLITDGILRMRNRNGFDHWEFMEAGKVYEIEVDLWSTAYIWNKGHKIRVEVSSSNAPRFLANPNTRAPIASDGETKIAHNTLYFGNAYPSCILLPVVTGAEFQHEASKASTYLNYLIKKSRAKILGKLSFLPDKIAEDFMEELSKNYYDDL